MNRVTDIPAAGLCTFCGGPITDSKLVGHWKECDGGGGFWFSGKCTACDVDFRLAVRNGVFESWQPDAPDAKDLRAILCEKELATLTNRFQRYATLGPKWQVFLARRRVMDEVWRFGSADGLHNGFAVVRDGRPVSRFAVFGQV